MDREGWIRMLRNAAYILQHQILRSTPDLTHACLKAYEHCCLSITIM